MENNILPQAFANPKPVKRNENPGVMLTVNGKVVFADNFIYSQEISVHLALKWVEELRQQVHKMERAILYATDALDVGTLAEYVEEIQALEQEAMDDQGEDVP
jgi:hypothetical protein